MKEGSFYIKKLACIIISWLWYLNLFGANLFLNTTGDELWNTAGNWSMGVVPDSTMDVTVSGAVTNLKIPAGYTAKCNILYVSQTVRVQAGGILKVIKKIYIQNNGDELINNGKIILPPNNYGIKISSYGKLTNNAGDSILIQSTTQEPALINFPIDCRGGYVVNRGYISITNCDEMNAINMTNIPGFYGKISNRASGEIIIDQAEDAGIVLIDSLENFGIISVSNTNLVSNVNYDSYGIWIQGSFGKLINDGTITLSNVGDIGIWNDGSSLTNNANGEINISGFEKTGFLNEGIFTTYGDINLTCLSNLSYNKGIHLNNGSSFFRGGSNTRILGGDQLDYGIYANRNFTLDSLATVTMEGLDENGFFTTNSLFTNRGYFEVKNSLQQYFTGIEMQGSVFDNYGTIYFENCYYGIRIYSSFLAENYGQIICKDLTGYGINTNGDFTNKTNGTINVFHINALEGFSSGLFHVHDIGSGVFTNDGTFNVLNLYLGIDFRTGSIINNGTITIDNIKWGVELGAYAEACVFTNNATINIKNQNDAARSSMTISSAVVNTYNFINSTNGNLNFSHCGSGLRLLSGGMKNEGQVTFTSIDSIAINSLPATPNNYHLKNTSTGTIVIDTANRGVYFNVVVSNTNRLPVINDGIFIFKNINNEAIDATSPYLGFTNNGTIAGTCYLDCNAVTLQNHIKPGNTTIGIIAPNNFSSNFPTYDIDIRGNSGFGYPLGNDGILFTNNVTINGNLNVNLLNGFTPAMNAEYIIMTAQTYMINGIFANITLPNFASDREFIVEYLSNRIKLIVVPKYKVWTGTTSTSWNVASNWSDGIVPDSNAYVKIPNVTNDPILGSGTFVINNGSMAATYRCKQMLIDPSALITFNNTIVQNYGKLEVYGIIIHIDTGVGSIRNFTGSQLTLYNAGSIQMSQ